MHYVTNITTDNLSCRTSPLSSLAAENFMYCYFHFNTIWSDKPAANSYSQGSADSTCRMPFMTCWLYPLNSWPSVNGVASCHEQQQIRYISSGSATVLQFHKKILDTYNLLFFYCYIRMGRVSQNRTFRDNRIGFFTGWTFFLPARGQWQITDGNSMQWLHHLFLIH